MFVGRRGYVGMVTQEDGTLDVAAALDRGWVRDRGTPEEAVTALVREAGGKFPAGEVLEGWRGTPPLDASPAAEAAERLFRVGDAAGYVEPFTGEGMSWALWGAALLAPLAVQGAARWDPALAVRWPALHRRTIVRRQRGCRAVAWLSRHPYLSGAAIRLSKRLPGAADRAAGALSRPYELEIHAGPAARSFAGEKST